MRLDLHPTVGEPQTGCKRRKTRGGRCALTSPVVNSERTTIVKAAVGKVRLQYQPKPGNPRYRSEPTELAVSRCLASAISFHASNLGQKIDPSKASAALRLFKLEKAEAIGGKISTVFAASDSKPERSSPGHALGNWIMAHG